MCSADLGVLQDNYEKHGIAVNCMHVFVVWAVCAVFANAAHDEIYIMHAKM